MARPQKLKIVAYQSDDYQEEIANKEFTVQINPEKWEEEFSVKYTTSSTQGGAATQLRFDHLEQGKLTLELYFDSTGLVSTTPKSQKGMAVQDQIKELKELCLDIDSKEHQPVYLSVEWGTFKFQGVLVNLKVDYTLINSGGTPIRAKATTTFESSLSLKKASLEADQQSPDMTHIKQIVGGDTLPNMAYGIYKDPKYYVQVAQFNRLDQFRSLDIGTHLQFPPLSK